MLSPSDVISAKVWFFCSYVLQLISIMSFDGYLAGNAQLLADLVSAFTGQGQGNFTDFGSAFNVSVAASSLVHGIQLGMVAGQSPVSLVTPNMQLTVTSTLIFASNNIVLTTPNTSGSVQSTVTLGPDGLRGCGAINEYAYMSVLQWSVNPYIYDMGIKTHQLRLAYTNGHETSQVLESPADTGIPAYYIYLQFSSSLTLNDSALLDGQAAHTRGHYNYTHAPPVCKLYDDSAYVECVGCTLDHFTNYSVTFKCFDITQLCPSRTTRRRLSGEYSKRSPVGTLSYSALVATEISGVLSSNPFKLDLTVISFMGTLCGCIIIIIFYLLRKDHNEKLYKKYLKSEADNLARKLLKDEIKKGGNGDLGKSFQSQVKSLNMSIKSVKTLSSALSRTLSGKVDNHCRHKGANFLGVKFDFDDRESDEFDSECGDAISVNEGEDSNFGYENIYGGGNSLQIVEKARVGIKDWHTAGKRNSEKGRSNNSEEAKLAEKVRTTAIVTEFMFKLFPGRSIFVQKKNLWGIVAVHHKFLSMFSASTVTQTRTIRFFNVLSLILTQIFASTVFFRIYYPPDSGCSSMTNKVNHIRRYCATVRHWSFIQIFFYICLNTYIIYFYSSDIAVILMLVWCRYSQYLHFTTSSKYCMTEKVFSLSLSNR